MAAAVASVAVLSRSALRSAPFHDVLTPQQPQQQPTPYPLLDHHERYNLMHDPLDFPIAGEQFIPLFDRGVQDDGHSHSDTIPHGGSHFDDDAQARPSRSRMPTPARARPREGRIPVINHDQPAAPQQTLVSDQFGRG